MDEFEATIYATMLSSANLALSLYCLWRAFKRKMSPFVLLWLTSIYFVGIPLFVDSLATSFGYREEWIKMLGSFNRSYQYNWTPLTIAWTALFVFLFNVLLFLSASICFRLGKRWAPTFNAAFLRSPSMPFLSLFLPIVLGWVGLLLFFALDIPSLSGTFGNILMMTYTSCLTLSGIGAFYATRDKRYILLVLSLLPTVILASYSGQRPYIVPTMFCAFYGYVVSQDRFRWRSLIKIAVLCYVVIFALLIVRSGFSGTMDKFFGNMPYPVDRDISSDILYYCFSEKGLYDDKGTNFSGVRRLALTGVLPRVLFGERSSAIKDPSSLDVTRYVAVKRHKWEYGTLHPTLYGWFFLDMKWWGILVAIPLAIALSAFELISTKNLFLRVIVVTTTAMFIVVAMRGSVQYAYSRTIYAAIIGAMLFFISWLQNAGDVKQSRNASKLLAPNSDGDMRYTRKRGLG